MSCNDAELMARIKDCSEDIANITQVAVLKQNVSWLINGWFGQRV